MYMGIIFHTVISPFSTFIVYITSWVSNFLGTILPFELVNFLNKRVGWLLLKYVEQES